MIVTSSYNILTLLLIILASILTSVLAFMAKHTQFRPRKHRQGVQSQHPKTKDSQIRERRKIGLEAAYHKIDEQLQEAYAEIETEKIRLKEEAVREYEKLLKYSKEVADDMDIDGNSESLGDDDKEVESVENRLDDACEDGIVCLAMNARTEAR